MSEWIDEGAQVTEFGEWRDIVANVDGHWLEARLPRLATPEPRWAGATSRVEQTGAITIYVWALGFDEIEDAYRLGCVCLDFHTRERRGRPIEWELAKRVQQ